MTYSNQPEIPVMAEKERGQLLLPREEVGLATIEIVTASWVHLCSARFGPARKSRGETWSWTGDAYRYDLFEGTNSAGQPEMAMRWQNGAGSGWLVLPPGSDDCEAALFRLIRSRVDEAKRWDCCHFLWKMREAQTRAARYLAEQEFKQAFIDGRVKKRKIRGTDEYTVVVQPRIGEVG